MCDTLIGIPFMIKARLVHDIAQNVVTSGVFGVRFNCTMEKPTSSDDLPAHVEGQGAAVLTAGADGDPQASMTTLTDGRGGVSS